MRVYKSFVINLFIISSLLIFPTFGSSVTRNTEFNSNLKKTELDTNLIDPDLHIYDIPIGTNESKFKQMFGEPNGYFRFSSTSTAMLYGQTHLFFFYKHRLSGVRIGHPVIIDLYVTNNLPSNIVFSEIDWSFSNGINADSNLQDIIDAYGDRLQMEFGREGYTAFYRTNSAIVKFVLRRNHSGGNETKAWLIKILEIERLGLAEQPASP
mgnify:CR=1 FL=1